MLTSINVDRMRTLVIITQVYVPDPAAVGQQIADVAAEMSYRGWRVVVFTSARGYENPKLRYPRYETRGGVEIRRLPFSSFGKGSMLKRVLGQLLFVSQAAIAACFVRQVTAVLVSTSPPFAPAAGVAVAVLRGVPLTWWVMDLNPDQLVATGRIKSTAVLVRLLDWLNRLTLRKARDVIVLDRFMEARIRSKTPVNAAVHVVPPWAHDRHIKAATNAMIKGFRERHGLAGKFVVMYAGNHSELNPLDTVIQAAIRMRGDERVAFVFVGGGTGKSKIDELARAGAPNIFSLPYQPLQDLGAVLGAADLHVVAMGADMVGIVHPCKIYGVLAASRPVLYLGPRPSHVTEIFANGWRGWDVRHGDVHGAIAAIECAMAVGADEPLDQRPANVDAAGFATATLGSPAQVYSIITAATGKSRC